MYHTSPHTWILFSIHWAYYFMTVIILYLSNAIYSYCNVHLIKLHVFVNLCNRSVIGTFLLVFFVVQC